MGVDQFDPDLIHETFIQTIRDLKILQERQQRKCENLEKSLKEEQKVHVKSIDILRDKHQVFLY